MKTKLNYSLILLCLVLLMPNMAFAIDISLAWDENPEPDIAGYKLYYQADSASLPLEGTGAIEGDSPIDVGNNINFTLTDLPDGRVYYFAVNAYNAAGVESGFSNIVASTWVPELIAPFNGTPDESTAETFIWGTAPGDYDVNYTLYYGTDPELKTITTSTIPGLPRIELKSLYVLPLVLLFGLIFTVARAPRRAYAGGAMAIAMGLALAGCGGDGGLNSPVSITADTSLSLTDNPAVSAATASVVFKDKAVYHEVYDLAPATTYYWKVVAVDVTNPGLKYESTTNSFTTAAY